ncbi:MAG: hypothetical protein HOP36_10305 [Methyloglobulus sp.]|nr:hypothetical protein [Methyloglobulus sp.]
MGQAFSLGWIFHPAFRDFLDPSREGYQESLGCRDITRTKTMFYINIIKTVAIVDEVTV